MQNNDNQDSGFTSVSISKADQKKYSEARDEWAKKHNIDPKKISLAMFINTGMTFYIQRMNLGMLEDQKNETV